MSKEELLKYLIAEIDLIMHDKDYRFENQDGTWYSRESCRDLTNEEVFEELKGELRQLADLEAKLAESENTITNLVEDNRASQEWYKQQLAEKEKERHEEWKTGKEWKWEWQKVNQKLKKADQDKISFAVYELSLVNGMLTDAIIELTQNETDANKLYYLEKIAKKFAEKTGKRINELKEGK